MTKRRNAVAANAILDPDHEDMDVASVESTRETVVAEQETPTIAPQPDETFLVIPEQLVELIHLDLPLVPIPEDDKFYISNRIDLRLNHSQARTLAGVFRALHDTHQQTNDGKHVDTIGDSIRWILDRIESLYCDKKDA